MQATSDSRMLQPVMERLRSDGAPFVPLSPHKGLKNAMLLYEAIKSVPGKTLMRGDFGLNGRPRVHLMEKQKKSIGKLSSSSSSPIKARNIDADRQDLANFLSSIADAALQVKAPDQKSLCAVPVLKKIINDALTARRDIRVQQIREPLRTLANTYRRIERQNLIAHYHRLPKQSSYIQSQRFAQFCAIKPAAFAKLVEALKAPSASRYDVDTSLAIHEVKLFLRTYQKAKTERSVNFSDYLRSTIIPQGVCLFAQRWLAISQPQPTTKRMQFDTQSWSKEFDKICPAIINAYHRQVAIDGLDQPCQPAESQLVYQRQTLKNLPELPPLPTAAPSPPSSPEAQMAVVQKAMPVPALSVHESAHPVSVGSLAQKASMLIHTPFNSNPSLDTTLINEIQSLIDSKGTRYQPVPSSTRRAADLPAPASGEDSRVRAKQNPGIFYQLPKVKPKASSGLYTDPLAVSDTSSLSRSSVLLEVSSTIAESTSEPVVATPAKPDLPPPFKLELSLSDDQTSDDDLST